MRDSTLASMITIGAGLFVGSLYLTVAVLQPNGFGKRLAAAYRLTSWPPAAARVVPTM